MEEGHVISITVSSVILTLRPPSVPVVTPQVTAQPEALFFMVVAKHSERERNNRVQNKRFIVYKKYTLVYKPDASEVCDQRKWLKGDVLESGNGSCVTV